ncbi:alternative oxidase-domain-containing protein [Pilobolus umbonatus]|nr:alternative oxidase-domain-containing protein [Pilobolus umbonatus]
MTQRALPSTLARYKHTFQKIKDEKTSNTNFSRIPHDVYKEILQTRPLPMREEFTKESKLSTDTLEKIEYGEGKHYVPQTLSDKVAMYTVKALRVLPDTYFGKDHYMRVVMLETVAAVPGMVGGMLRHMKSLRNLSEDRGWIDHLLHEAENERMHLMTWLKCLQPNMWNRFLILGVQGVFFNAYFAMYMLSPKMCHRMCGYLEEEAVISYTHFLNDIDAGIQKNGPAPAIAIDYYNLQPNATIRDVVLAVRADEALHRDANHFFSDRLAAHKEDIETEVREIAQHEHHHSNA